MSSTVKSDVVTAPNTANVDQPSALGTVTAQPAPVAPPASVKTPAKRVVKTPAKKVAAQVKPVTKVAIKPVAKKAAPKVAVKLVVRTTPPVAAKATVKAPPKVEPKVIASTVKQDGTKLLKAKKPKLVRDSFTIPKLEYLTLEALKQRGGKLGNSIKKSELIRAGIKALAEMSDTNFLKALKAVPAIKTGRPAKA
jgi:hypothetical protein